jgi:hypothetical protein
MAPRKKAEAATNEGTETPVKASKDSVTVKYRDHTGSPTERVYSRDLHGDDFADLADEFRKSNASKIIE